jgi:HPt (histidine-containing phosphotransfer) domain-containing protein
MLIRDMETVVEEHRKQVEDLLLIAAALARLAEEQREQIATVKQQWADDETAWQNMVKSLENKLSTAVNERNEAREALKLCEAQRDKALDMAAKVALSSEGGKG